MSAMQEWIELEWMALIIPHTKCKSYLDDFMSSLYQMNVKVQKLKQALYLLSQALFQNSLACHGMVFYRVYIVLFRFLEFSRGALEFKVPQMKKIYEQLVELELRNVLMYYT